MKISTLHSWDLTPTEAVALQRELAGRLDVKRSVKTCEFIAGADCSYNRFSPKLYCAVIVLRTSDWSIVETQGVVGESTFPYVPGLLSFREIPIVLQAFAKLEHCPDAVMCDGQGYAHPRRMGLACHLGLWLQIPTFGCAKTRLIGEHDDPAPDAGATTPLRDKGELIGQVVRTKNKTKPVYVSVGNLIDLASAVKLTLQSCCGYRIPEPTRQAHLHVNQMRLRDRLSEPEA
ncbi:MAG: endonuclease V [Planctomycetes bacterium]|nr:endonuclease V [Planctomycetota bacterium]